MYTIRKEFHFSASHQLIGLHENHPCTRLHGHNYKVTLEFQSTKLNHVGFVIDYRDLQSVKQYLDDTFDHKHLNDVCPYNPTAELLAKGIFKQFETEFCGLLVAVEVSETDKTMARYEPAFD